jgi:hypothetical protein
MVVFNYLIGFQLSFSCIARGCPGANAQKATCDAFACKADLQAVVPQGEGHGYYGDGGKFPPLREWQERSSRL